MLTEVIIPTNGVWIVRTYGPIGFSAAIYDHEGFTSQGRWFDTLAKAQAYADSLKTKAL